MKITCQAGTKKTKTIGDLPGFPEPVWHTPGGIVNVLSLASMRKHYAVTYDGSSEAPGFRVRTNAGVLLFKESEKGLYYYDTNSSHSPPPQHAFVSTVDQQRESFTNRQYHQAKLAREIQKAKM